MKSLSFGDWCNRINGVQITGFAEGDGVVEFEWLGKDKVVVGADGMMTVHLTANRSVKVTLHLDPASSGNAFLSKLWGAQRGGPRTLVPVVYTAQDSYRQDKLAGWHGVITSPAKPSKGEQAGKMSWEMTFQQGVMNLGDPDFAGLLTTAAEVMGPTPMGG